MGKIIKAATPVRPIRPAERYMIGAVSQDVDMQFLPLALNNEYLTGGTILHETLESAVRWIADAKGYNLEEVIVVDTTTKSDPSGYGKTYLVAVP